MNTIKRFINDEQGLESVEYAVLAALLLGGVITIVGVIGTKIYQRFQALDTALSPPPAP